ncbi:adenylate/guanylate cyclase domain-containing protein [Gordonia sp. X0973]|uniref:adenylate/guanylate cyclase domain-containing protein n=1 Tax=Gordonia sp. X0973 TaxID=2742602 RepID=UPI000F529990|nr:adenylate/guanylate cyclase domain-containing protein [Gordonia sp. X0973]QKT06062.1 adenylate/guanylate cyclase domain-containing protein [Gordonia sp. X0973]
MADSRSRWDQAVHTARWLARTPWPILALDLLRANMIGAIFTFAFLRFGMASDYSLTLTDASVSNQVAFVIYLFIAMIVGGLLSIKLSLPVLIWHRRRTRPDDEFARRRALALPWMLTVANGVLWLVGGTLLAILSGFHSGRTAILVAIGSLIGALVTGALSFLQTEKVLRPITVAAMANNPDDAQAPSVSTRITTFWVIAVAVPQIVIIGLVLFVPLGIASPQTVLRPILWMAGAALAFGALAVYRLVSSINDPIKQLRNALSQVRNGNLNASVRIYDGSDLGLLQAGFNEMVSDLRERNRLRNLFGRYVGEDVARRAIETGTELGGEDRYVGVLFVDIVGSTRLAVQTAPREVVEQLNEFFRVVVDVVGRHGGFVNKFQGDAALAIFGAPLELDNFAGCALAAARELRIELENALGDTDFGIGVSAGRAVAGHIGSEQRLEYTVIGDPVNEAARLTELAKDEPTRVLGSARAVFLADEDEASHWEIGEGVELRGRGIETLLSRPKIGPIGPIGDGSRNSSSALPS